MGKIAFSLPRISTSAKYGRGQYSQKGPTCWYYAAKILSKLHNNTGRAGLRQLHWVRKAIGEVSDLAPYLGEEASEDPQRVLERITFLETHFRTWIKHYEDVRDNEILKPSRTYENKVREAATLAFRFRLGVPDYATAKRKLAEMAAAKVKLAQAADLTRFTLLNAFAPGLFTRRNVVAATLTSAAVEKILRKWGPFYASGQVWTGSRNVVALVELGGNTFGADTIGAVDHFEDGSHAVLVCGMDTDTDTIYYKDPNNTAQVRSIAYGTFHGGWNVGGTCTVITMTCPDRNDQYAADGGCQHTMQAIVLNSISEMFGIMFG
jgi:hypothetical protein